MSFSHKCDVYLTISEEYPKEEDGKKNKKSEFLMEGQTKKEQIWSSELRTLCTHSYYEEQEHF